ncbi:MAG: hypothetical protein ACPGU9_05810 [Flavobacteriaceae bacterium]
MTFKRVFLTGVLFLLAGNVFATDKNIDKKNIDKKACKYVQEQIATIESFYTNDEGYSLELLEASQFLTNISEIESNYLYSYEAIGDTLETNDVIVWKNWFEANKHLLTWDEELNTVVIKTEE